jgi:membrane-bound lytic murein transglycosylase B
VWRNICSRERVPSLVCVPLWHRDDANPTLAVAGRDLDDLGVPSTVAGAAPSCVPCRMKAYGAATLREQAADPRCHLAWTTLAGIGWVESQHGTLGGLRDGAGAWQRAIGPLQSIPSTWARWASDGDGDGVSDPHDLDDAAYAAARDLCAPGGDLGTGPGWSTAVFSYNHSTAYVRSVYDAAQAYADRTAG